jgi:hypothetical protein
MEIREQDAIGDALREACMDRYLKLLRTLNGQIEDPEATKLILSAATAALLELWRNCCQGDEENIKAAVVATVEQHWKIVCASRH